MSDDEITCRELVGRATDYSEEALAPAERRRFDGHLARCPGCHTYLDQLRYTIRAIGQTPEEPLSPDAKQRLLDAFRSQTST